MAASHALENGKAIPVFQILDQAYQDNRALVTALAKFMDEKPHGSFTLHCKGVLGNWEIRIIGEKDS